MRGDNVAMWSLPDPSTQILLNQGSAKAESWAKVIHEQINTGIVHVHYGLPHICYHFTRVVRVVVDEVGRDHSISSLLPKSNFYRDGQYNEPQFVIIV
jgi:hypothetical protein